MTLDRICWLLATIDDFELFMDHNNVIFLFGSTSIIADISQGTLPKVLRWAVRLTLYSYTCFRVKGEDNVWADVLGHWSTVPLVRRILKISRYPLGRIPVPSGHLWQLLLRHKAFTPPRDQKG